MKRCFSFTRFVQLAVVVPCMFTASAFAEEAEGLDAFSLIDKKSGKVLVVEVQGVKGGKVQFKYKGKSFNYPLSKFKDGTEEMLEGLLNEKKQGLVLDSTKINGGVGHALFGDVSLWDEKASDVAKRLKWPKESLKKDSSSYRYYPDFSYQFLGARPYCATLYGGEGEIPLRFSLVFANKGDYGSKVGFGADHFKKVHPEEELPNTLEEAIKLDAKLIQEKLTEALGVEPVKQRFGEKEDKRNVLRWDYENHSFLLSELDGEYVSLLIVPTEVADLEGKVEFVKDSELKEKLVKNIVKKENGDVYIDNIPMVNQGPKGYCAPATFERAMSYMHIPADMYLLATAATQVGGGTNTTQLADDCKRIIRSKARRIKDLDLDRDLKIKTVAKYVDKGVPILWQMRSLEGYNELASKRTKEREKVTDFNKWASEIMIEAASISPSLESVQANHHICMIIGYNEETEEICVSDSWGPKYELRWVHISVAQAVTSRGGFVIDY